MTKQMNFVTVFVLAALLAGGLAGCSVETKSVVNNPPVVPERVMTFDNELGRLKPESMTVFLWPEFSSEKEAENAIQKVNTAAKSMDLLSTQFHKLNEEESVKEQEFQALECPLLTSDDGTWKQPSDDKTAEKLKVCMSNKAALELLQESKGQINEKQVNYLGQIIDVIDPDSKGNWKSLNARQSRFEFVQGADGKIEASIRLKDFGVEGNTQSSEEDVSTVPEGRITDVVYDTSRKVLTFKVPEIVAEMTKEEASGEMVPTGNLIATGGVYHFMLERANFLGQAKFAGDVKLIYPDGKIRVGSASLTGPLVAD